MPQMIREERAFPLGSVTKAEVELAIAKGSLRVRGGATEFCEATFEHSHAELEPEIEFEADGGEAELSVRQPRVTIEGRTRASWDLRFNDDVSIEAGIRSASGEVDLDFSGMRLANVEVDSASGAVRLRIDGGSPDLREVIVDSTSGGVSVELGGAFPALARIEVDSKSGRVTIAAAGSCPALERIAVEATSGGVDINLGACEFPDDDVNVRVNAVSGSVNVTIPEGAGASLGASVVSGSVTAEGFQGSGGRMVNAAFGESEGTIWLNLKAISGSLRVLTA